VAGKLVPSKAVKGKVVYHDSCYLGRYNQVYDSPRQILEAIEGLELTEVPYWNRNKGLCCGAGGAQMFMEEQGPERVNNKRTLQLIDTGATTIASGCPFCMTMLTDGLKDEEKEESIAQRDIAEILADAIELDEVEPTPVAAQ
jgi:Fe-S oxidoreductase